MSNANSHYLVSLLSALWDVIQNGGFAEKREIEAKIKNTSNLFLQDQKTKMLLRTL